jgi:hypothetical protein
MDIRAGCVAAYRRSSRTPANERLRSLRGFEVLRTYKRYLSLVFGLQPLPFAGERHSRILPRS